MKLTLLSALFLSCQLVFGQSVKVDGTELPGTETFEFRLSDEYAYRQDGLKVVIGRYNNENGNGFIKLTVKTGDGLGIKGRVSLQLDDGSTLVLEDKGKRTYEDDHSSNIFDLSATQVQSLKERNLRNIRFSVKCINCFLSTKEGNFVANNDDNVPVLEMVNKLFNDG